MRERNYIVDIIKAIGCMLIILAHINPPKFIGNLRIFDVVLMVFASGLTLKAVRGNYFAYILKRFKRLVLPTWIFLVIYFAFCYLLNFLGCNLSYSLKEYICSFAFIGGGIDYVWIIRVYFLMAIISPVIFSVSNWTKGKVVRIMTVILGLIIINEILVRIIGNGNNIVVELLRGIFLYAFGYGIAEVLACSVRGLKSFKIALITVILFGIWIIMWILNGYKELQEFKYPPQALYLLYGMSVSLILYIILSIKPVFYKGKFKYAVEWISIHSLTIYLCHIIPVTLIQNFEFNIINSNFIFRYIFVVVIAILLTILFNLLKKYIFIRISEKI